MWLWAALTSMLPTTLLAIPTYNDTRDACTFQRSALPKASSALAFLAKLTFLALNMHFPTSTPLTFDFSDFDKLFQNAYTLDQQDLEPNFGDLNSMLGNAQGIQPKIPAAAPTTQWNNTNALGLNGPYNFPIPQSALPLRVDVGVANPARNQQSSSLVARNGRQFSNYVRMNPYMNARMMRWPALNPQSNAAPPPYSAVAPSLPTNTLGPHRAIPAQAASTVPMHAPKPVRSWHVQALQSLSAIDDTSKASTKPAHDAARVKLEEEAKLLDQEPIDVLPAEYDANKGLYRAFRADTGQRLILHNHSFEASLSASDQAELAEMRRMVTNGDYPTACRLSGCNHIASCTRYLVKHVHAHLCIRYQCEYCPSNFGARADSLTEHVKKEHPEMLAVFKWRRMHRKPPVVPESVEAVSAECMETGNSGATETHIA